MTKWEQEVPHIMGPASFLLIGKTTQGTEGVWLTGAITDISA